MTFEKWWDQKIEGGYGEVEMLLREAWSSSAKEEREACAKTCDAQAILQDDAFRYGLTPIDGDLANRCATYIRERSNEN